MASDFQSFELDHGGARWKIDRDAELRQEPGTVWCEMRGEIGTWKSMNAGKPA